MGRKGATVLATAAYRLRTGRVLGKGGAQEAHCSGRVGKRGSDRWIQLKGPASHSPVLGCPVLSAFLGTPGSPFPAEWFQVKHALEQIWPQLLSLEGTRLPHPKTRPQTKIVFNQKKKKIKTWAEDLNGYISRERTSGQQVQRHHESAGKRKPKPQGALSLHLSEWPSSKPVETTVAARTWRKGTLVPCQWECSLVQLLWETAQRVLKTQRH